MASMSEEEDVVVSEDMLLEDVVVDRTVVVVLGVVGKFDLRHRSRDDLRTRSSGGVRLEFKKGGDLTVVRCFPRLTF